MALNEPVLVPESLSKSLSALGSRLRFYREADGDLIRGMHRGVFFIVAFWSGPSLQAVRPFVDAVLAEDPAQLLEVIVVDNDGLQGWENFREIREIDGGWGELIAVYHGKIMGTSGFGFRPETYRKIVRSLVEWDQSNPTLRLGS